MKTRYTLKQGVCQSWGGSGDEKTLTAARKVWFYLFRLPDPGLLSVKRIILLFSTVLLILSVIRADGSIPTSDSIRVAILKGVDRISITADGLLAMSDSGEALPLGREFEVREENGLVRVGGTRARTVRMSAPDALALNGRRYRGIIEISRLSGGGLLVVNELPLEEYLVGLINCEISSHWPIEAVKAQAVIARTYALYQKRARSVHPYHLESTVLDQVYAGSDQEDARSRRAVEETAGEVLTYGGELIQAFYHSSCGGGTESADQVWGVSLPYIEPVTCRYCLESPSVRWEQTLSLRSIETSLKMTGVKDIRVKELSDGGRVRTVELLTPRGWVSISGVAFRKGIGYSVVKSTRFTLERRGDEAILKGAGSGHGVGLCQWGAKERALEGFSYREILSYYYPKAVVQSLGSR